MRGRTLLAGLVLAVLLSGCGTASVPRESVPPPSPSAAPRQQSPPAPVPTPPAAPSEGRDSELRYHTTSSYDLEIGIRRTTLDAQGRCLSVYFEVPVFEEATAGYRKINAFFEELTERFFSPDNQQLTAAWGYASGAGSLAVPEAPFFYQRPAAVGAHTAGLVSVTIGYQWMMGGVLDYGSDSYTFRTDTGELLGLADLVDAGEYALRELIFTALKERVSQDEREHGSSPIDLEHLKGYELDYYEFAVDENGAILLLFDKYEAADGAYGGFDLTLPVPLKPDFI